QHYKYLYPSNQRCHALQTGTSPSTLRAPILGERTVHNVHVPADKTEAVLEGDGSSVGGVGIEHDSVQSLVLQVLDACDGQGLAQSHALGGRGHANHVDLAD